MAETTKCRRVLGECTSEEEWRVSTVLLHPLPSTLTGGKWEIQKELLLKTKRKRDKKAYAQETQNIKIQSFTFTF